MSAAACCCIRASVSARRRSRRRAQDLAAIGVFSVVRIEPADQLDPDGTIPIPIDVTERPLHSVDVGAAYSTDLGVNLNAGWHHRNLFGNAEQLNLTGGIQLGGNAVQQPGYNVGVQFIKPDFLARDQSLEIDLGAVESEPGGLRPAGADAEDRDRPQAVGRTGPSASACQRRAGGDHPGGCDAPLRPGRPAAVGAVRQHQQPARSDRWLPRRAAAHADPVASARPSATFVIAQLSGSDLFRPERQRAQRGGAARPGGQGVRRRTCSACRPTSASMPAARAPCAAFATSRSARNSPTASRPAAPRSAPASVELRQRILEQLRRGGVRRCRPGDRERRAVHQQLARRRRHRGAVLHLDRANSSRRRNAIEPRAAVATLSNCTSASDRPSDAARGEMDRLDRWRYWSALPVLLSCRAGRRQHRARKARDRVADADADRRHGPARRHLRPVSRCAARRAGRIARPARRLRHRRGRGARLVAAATAAPTHRDRPAGGGAHRRDAACRPVRPPAAASACRCRSSCASCGSRGWMSRAAIGRHRRLRSHWTAPASCITDAGASDIERPPARRRGQLHAEWRDGHGRAAGHAACQRARAWYGRRHRGLPDLGAIELAAQLDGPRSAVATHVTLTAGPLHASADGTLDLEHSAGDLALSVGARRCSRARTSAGRR